MTMIPPVLAHMKTLGHKVFDNPKYDYDLNLFGIRNSNGEANTFDDFIGVFYLWDRTWRGHFWPGTVDPGLHWLENPSNVKGTAVLCPGQYSGAYEIGKHRGQYDALVQTNAPVKVWRDPDRDRNIDTWGEVDEGFFGINIHKAGKVSTKVDKWSAGCQVLRYENDLDELIELCRKQVRINGWETFTYTLLDQWW